MRGHDKRENTISQLQDLCAHLKAAHTAAREALGEVTETFSEDAFVSQSGADFGEKVVNIVRRELDEKLKFLASSHLY